MGLFDFLNPVRNLIEDFIVNNGLNEPPWSAIVLVVISLFVTTISGLVNRGLLDMEELSKKQEEISKHNERKKKAMETADKKLWISVKRNEDRIMDLQKSTMMKRMLPSLITMGPFIFIFTTFRRTFQQLSNQVLNWNCVNEITCDPGQDRHGVVAVLPFKIHDVPLLGSWFSPYVAEPGLSVAGFSFWYFLSAIIVSTLIQRLFGINVTGMQNPGMGGR